MHESNTKTLRKSIYIYAHTYIYRYPKKHGQEKIDDEECH